MFNWKLKDHSFYTLCSVKTTFLSLNHPTCWNTGDVFVCLFLYVKIQFKSDTSDITILCIKTEITIRSHFPYETNYWHI